MAENPPLILGILNASPDSFSGNSVGASSAVDLALTMVQRGADALDLGAQSLRTDTSEISTDEELDRLLPVLEAVREALPTVPLSVDTYRAEVAEHAVKAGATILNDPSGLQDEQMAQLAATSGVDIVLTYNRAAVKQRLLPSELVEDVVTDCIHFVRERVEMLRSAGVDPHQIILDPGVDLGQSPAQSVQILQQMEFIRKALDRPRVLWALSRKDFIGAILRRPPLGRGPGTLGALSVIPYQAGDLLRVHDVSATSEFLAVRHALMDGVDPSLLLPVDLRHEVEQ